MTDYRILRQRIKNVAEAPRLNDGDAIEGICRLLNVQYPVEKQTVKNDLTLSEAVEKAYAIQKQYTFGGVDKKLVEVQLKSYEAIGLIKFKEDHNIERSHTIYRSYNKVIVISETVIKKVAQKLREKCAMIFGTSWNNQNAEEFAKTAIEEYERLVNK